MTETVAVQPTTASATSSLVDRLKATNDSRLAAINASRPKHAKREYHSGANLVAWTTGVFYPFSRGLHYVAVPLSFVFLLTCAWTIFIVNYDGADAMCVGLMNAESAFRICLTALSFLLVYRLNRSATRHYEARQLCGLIIINCRDFAVTSVSLLNAHPETCDKLCEIAVGFPVAFMLHIWGDPASRADSFATMCEGVFDAPTMDALKAAKSRPLFLIERAQRIILDHYRRESLVLDPHCAVLESRVYNSLINTARGLGVPLGGCERIQGTPLPFAYVAHLRTFLLLILSGIPIVYGCEWHWATIPLSMLIAFGLLGVEAASVECERPFSSTPTKNEHDLEKFCTVLSTDVMEILERAVASV